MSSRRVVWGLQLIVGATLVAGEASADAGRARELLDAGDAAAERVEYRQAAEAFQKAIAEGGLTRAELERAYAGLAVASSGLQLPDEALSAFKVLLALQPKWTPSRSHGPKIRRPFEEAAAWWADKARPVTQMEHAAKASSEADFRVLARVLGDPLALVARLRLRHGRGAQVERLEAMGREAEFVIPRGKLPPESLEVSFQALDAAGSVVLESAGAVIPVEAVIPGEPAVAAGVPALQVAEHRETDSGPARLHLFANVLGHLASRGFGGELGASYSPWAVLDVGLGATVGANPGGQLTLALHPSWDSSLRPVVQLRGNVTPIAGQVVWGGGIWLGGQLEAGPGRLGAGVAAEAYHVPVDGYAPGAVFALAGYELDLRR